jgi:hypothetical protein
MRFTPRWAKFFVDLQRVVAEIELTILEISSDGLRA